MTQYLEKQEYQQIPAGDQREPRLSQHRFITGAIKNFDQKYTMFNRPRWDPEVKKYAPGIYGVLPTKDIDGHRLYDRALQNACWFLEMGFGHTHYVHGTGIYAWDKKAHSDCLRLAEGEKLVDYHIGEMTLRVKKAALTLGADLVGVCRLDRRWIYSRWFNLATLEEGLLKFPDQCTYAIALAMEMDYDMFRCSPNEIEGAASGMGYSKMAFVTGSLAHFIRNLGYTAIPSGNDTGLSIPIAVDAGLGELGRNGLLITRRFGPRVRLAKVFTNMPLAVDRPVQFGVDAFCEVCKKCVDECPSNAIRKEEKTDRPLNVSNSSGVLKWPVNAEHCFKFWSKNNCSCGNCIRVCPFNKHDNWFHTMVKWHVRNLSQFNTIYKWMDDVFGYGKQLKAKDWWAD